MAAVVAPSTVADGWTDIPESWRYWPFSSREPISSKGGDDNDDYVRRQRRGRIYCQGECKQFNFPLLKPDVCEILKFDILELRVESCTGLGYGMVPRLREMRPRGQRRPGHGNNATEGPFFSRSL